MNDIFSKRTAERVFTRSAVRFEKILSRLSFQVLKVKKKLKLRQVKTMKAEVRGRPARRRCGGRGGQLYKLASLKLCY